MEEKNELNDIILNKSGSGSSTKKLLLAIAALTLILIIVLVIMNSLKSESDERAPQAAVPPEPSSPTEVIDDPLFEPVEVIQEGAGNVSTTEAPQDLGQIAQKIKQESFQNTPVAPSTAPVPATAQQTVPAPQAKPAVQAAPAVVVNTPKVQTQPAPAKPVVTTPAPAKVQTAPKAAQPVINTPTIKTTKPTETKAATPKPTAVATPKAASPQKPAATPTKATAAPAQKTAVEPVAKPVAKAPDTTGTYYIQVGSFTKEPNKALFDRLNASGLKYITSPNGSMTKVMVGPFQGEKAARDVLGTVKRNIESNAYITKG